MKKKLLGLLSAAVVCLGVTSVHGFTDAVYGWQGWYVSGRGMVGWHNDMKFVKPTGTRTDKFKVGGGGSLALGGFVGNSWRFEVEGLYQYNPVDKSDFTNGTASTKSGHVDNLAFLFNVYYDLYLGNCFGLYLGGGIGPSFHECEITTEAGGIQTQAKRNETLFAWQVMPGIYYDVNECVRLNLGYRLFATSKAKSADKTVKTSEIPMTHSIEAGLTFRF